MDKTSEEFNLEEWWHKLDISWKRIFKRNIDINHNPNLNELKQILDIESIDCSNPYILSLEPLQYLNKLQKLNCSGTHITSLEKIRNLTMIDELDISYSNISNLEPISLFDNLWILKCNNTPLASLKGLEELTNLEYIYCSNTKVASLEPLEKLHNLKLLDCNSTLLDSIQPFQNMPDIKNIIQYSGTPLASKKIEIEYKDPLFELAVDLVLQHHNAKTTFFQQKLNIGYSRAKRIIVQLEKAGIIGPVLEDNTRELLIDDKMNPNDNSNSININSDLGQNNHDALNKPELVTHKKKTYQIVSIVILIIILVFVLLILNKIK
jgi:Ftsk gamma domain/Leucine Rich repeats (2 copies)